MGKQSKYENVMLRGRTVYARIPSAPDGSRRRVALPWIKLKAGGQGADSLLKLGRDVLACIETHLVRCAVPQWEIIEAMHGGRLSVQEVHSVLCRKDGVEHLQDRLKAGKTSEQALVEVAPLVDLWPAMPLDKTVEPTAATRKNRRARMRQLAKRLPRIKDWTTAGLQDVINPSDENAPRVGKGSTQLTYLRDARLFCAWLIANELLVDDPTLGVTVQGDEEQEIRCVDFPVLMKVYWAIEDRLVRDAFGLMVASGAEPQVISRLTAGDVRRKDQHARLRGSKNKYRKRWAFVESWYWPTLVSLAEGRRSDEKLIPVDRFKLADGVRKAVVKLRESEPTLDLPDDFRPYDARHSFAARYVKAGAVLKIVARQLGHKNEKMVIALYGHFEPETSTLGDLQQAAAEKGIDLRPRGAKDAPRTTGLSSAGDPADNAP